MNLKERINRRDFLGTATVLIGSAIGVVMGIPAVAYILSPALRKGVAEDWTRLGDIRKVEPGTPTLFKAKIERQTGWIQDERELSAYVLTDDGRDFIAMSNICTHLACRVRWIADREQFFCPCHNGVFDKEGNVISGPPPRPLDRYEIKVEGEQLFMLVG